jgi:hypothetical protein
MAMSESDLKEEIFLQGNFIGFFLLYSIWGLSLH